MGEENFKISQFADDTSFSITNNEQYINEIFKNLIVQVGIGAEG